MDDLLHFLRHEIAMDGDDGTPVDRLDSFVQAYYDRQAAASRESDSNNHGPIASTSKITSQNLDQPFMEFVWRQLVLLPELKVAFLRKLGGGGDATQLAATPQLADSGTPIDAQTQGTPQLEQDIAATASQMEGTSSSATANMNGTSAITLPPERDIDQGAYNLKNKAKIKAGRVNGKKKARDARLTHDAWEFCQLSSSEVENIPRSALVEKYGLERLRVAADPETCYVALTGSHERRGRLTHLTYQILQAIARGRENGKTVVDLGKEFDHDQKSLFHFVKSLVEMNFIVKIKISDQRTQTNRCIHRHYLEMSEHWATFQIKDVGSVDVKPDAAADSEDEDASTAPGQQLSIITAAHLNGNEPLVRARIVAALKREKDHMIPHIDMVFKIGFQYRPPRAERRRLNRILTSMVEKGIIEKVGVRQPGSRGDLSCIRLPEKSGANDNDNESGDKAGNDNDDDELLLRDVERPNILITIPVEKQLIDLLVEAGSQGLTIRDMKAALGELNSRTLEAILGRYEKSIHPPHLCDFAIQSVLETVGREKRLRWFSLAGYHERCRLDGLGDLPGMKQFSHPEEAGGFSRLETIGFYETPLAFREYASTWNTNSGAVAAANKPKRGQGKRGPDKKPRATKATAAGKAPGGSRGRPTKAAQLAKKLAEGEISQETYEEELAKGTTRSRAKNNKALLDQLADRLAKGEITQEQYDEQLPKVPKPRAPRKGKAASQEQGEDKEQGGETPEAEPKLHKGSKAYKLEQQFKNGEITQEQYEEQKKSLPKPKASRKRKADEMLTAEGGSDAGGSGSGAGPAPAKKRYPNSKLGKLEKALDEGDITQEQYEEQKAQLKTTATSTAKLTNAAKIMQLDKDLADGSITQQQYEEQKATIGKPRMTMKAQLAALEKSLTEGTVTQEEYEVQKAQIQVTKPAKKAGTSTAAASRTTTPAIAMSETGDQETEEPSIIPPPPQSDPKAARLEEVEDAFAAGDITFEQYVKRKHEIQRSRPEALSSSATAATAANLQSDSQQRESRAGSADGPAVAAAAALSVDGSQQESTSQNGSKTAPPNSPKTKGRPRKYPAGITALERTRLLEERREAGLEPTPAYKRKKSPTPDAEQAVLPRSERERTAVQDDSMMEGDVSAQDQQHENGDADMEEAEESSAGNTRKLRARPAKVAPAAKRRSKRGTRASIAPLSIDEGNSWEDISETLPAAAGGSAEGAVSSGPAPQGEDSGDPYADLVDRLQGIASESPAPRSSLATPKAGPKRGRRTYEKLVPGEKRPIGRPRKYARLAPPKIPKFNYGTYPDLVIYPAVSKEEEDEEDEEEEEETEVKEDEPIILSNRTRSGRSMPAETTPVPERQRSSSRRLPSARTASRKKVLSQSPRPEHGAVDDVAVDQPEPEDAEMQVDAASPGVQTEAEKVQPSGAASMRDRLRGLQTTARKPSPEKMPSPAPVGSSGVAFTPSQPPTEARTQGAASHAQRLPLAAQQTPQQIGQTSFVLPEMPLPDQVADNDQNMPHFDLPAMPEPAQDQVDMDNTHGDTSLVLDADVTILPPNPLIAQELKDKRAGNRKNYSMHLYSIEYAAALKENGGLAVEGHPFLRMWQEYKQKKDKLNEIPKVLDKRTSSTIINILSDNGTIKRSILQIPGKHGKLIQIPVMYLSEIALDSVEMKAFARSLQDQQQAAASKQKWLDGRKTLELEGRLITTRVKRQKPEERIQVGDNPRGHFEQEWRIVAQLYGWQYGIYARARTLHEFLVSSITDDNDSLFISSSRPEARIFSPSLPREDIPLSTYLSLVAVYRDAEELDAFLAASDASKVMVSQLPQSLKLMIRPPTEAFHKDRLFPLLNLLYSFRLLVPLDFSDEKTDIVAYSGTSREPRYFKARKLRGAKYLMLANRAPLYDLGYKDTSKHTLLGELPVGTLEQVQDFWESLKSVTFRKTPQTDLLPVQDEHPATLILSPTINSSVRIASQWYSQYILMKSQKTYIKRILEEQGALDTIGSAEAMTKLAYDVHGREDEVRRYAVSMAAMSRRAEAGRAKGGRNKKVKSKAPKVDDEASGTEGSENEEDDEDEEDAVAPSQRKKSLRSTASAKPSPANAEPTARPSVADVLARKQQNTDAERVKLWDGIYSRFLAEHGEDAVSSEQIAFLKTWFLSPGGISVPALQEHLQTMAEDSSILQPARPVLGVAKRFPATAKQNKIKATTSPRKRNPADEADKEDKLQPAPGPIVPFDIPDISFTARADGPKKTVASGWTDEEDDQLRDFYVIVQARANDLGQKFSTDPIRKYYPGVASKSIFDRLRRLAAVHEDAPYLDALQAAWKEIWLEGRKSGRLPDDDWSNLNGCDLGKHRSYLCAKLNKQAIRFQAMAPKGVVAAAQKDLPSDPEELLEKVQANALRPLSAREDAYAFDYLWATWITAAVKLQDYRYSSFTTPNARAPAYQQSYSSSDRRKLFTEKYDYQARLPDTTLSAAQTFEKTLAKEGEIEWQNIMEDGDMLALTHLFSDNLVDFKIDTTSTKDSRPYTDYRTRKIDDENMENDLSVSLNQAYRSLVTPIFG